MAPGFESAVLRKVAWRLMPFLSIAYMINALDRVNVSMAALTMNTALGLTASEYGLAAGAFFWSYVLFQFPANMILGRLGARLWISIIMAMWGAASAGTAFVTGETSFVAVRFLLGVAEAGFFPGAAYFMTCWFPAFYRGRMMGLFLAFAIFAGVLGGPLGAALLSLHGLLGLAGWQWLFLVEGLPAVLLAFYGFATLCNRPAEARWLAPEHRTWLQQQLDQEAVEKTGHGKGVLQSIASPEMLILIVAYLLLAYGIYAISFFLPLIVKSMGVSNTAIGYILVLPSICGSIGMILFSRSSDRTGERVWHVALPAALAGIASIAAALVLGNIYLTVLAFCVAMFGISSSIPVFWNLPTAYLGASAAAGGIALINSIGNISGYLAPQITGVLRDASGGYALPMMVVGVGMLVAGALIPLSGIGRHIRRGVPAAGVPTLLH